MTNEQGNVIPIVQGQNVQGETSFIEEVEDLTCDDGEREHSVDADLSDEMSDTLDLISKDLVKEKERIDKTITTVEGFKKHVKDHKLKADAYKKARREFVSVNNRSKKIFKALQRAKCLDPTGKARVANVLQKMDPTRTEAASGRPNNEAS